MSKKSSAKYDVAGLSNAPQQHRSHELSLRILTAAEALLRKEGLVGFTIAAVAKMAGASVGGIYGRFKDRDELLAAIHSHVLDRFEQQIRDAMSCPYSNLQTLLSGLVDALVDFWEREGDLMPLVRGRMAAAVRTEGLIRDCVAQAIQPFSKEIRHPHPEVAVRFLVHLLLASVTREYGSGRTRKDRHMGWPLIRQELTWMARTFLAGRLP